MYVNLSAITHYSNPDNLKSNPDYSTSTETDYIDQAKAYNHSTIVFAERNNVFNWYSKKKLLESNGMKYVHATRLNVITELAKESIVYSLLVIAKNYNGVMEINKAIGDSYVGREDKDNDNPNFYFVPRLEFDKVKQLEDVYFIFTGLDNPLWVNKKANKDNELSKWLSLLDNENSFVGISSDDRNENKFMNQYMTSLVEENRVLSIDLSKTHSRKNEYVRYLLNKSQNSQYENDNVSYHYRSDDEITKGLKSFGYNDNQINKYMSNTQLLVDSVEEFEMDMFFKYPHLFDNPEDRIKKLIKNGLNEKVCKNKSISKETIEVYKKQALHEYEVMKETGSIEFILLEQYVKQEMRNRNIYAGPGRGSVSGSLIAYLLNITDVDPIKENLIFERFMNKDRISLGDIDSDFSPEDKKKVQQFLLEHEQLHSASIITFGTYGIKGAVKDIGRSLGYSPSEMQLLSNSIDDYGNEYVISQEMREKYKLLIEYAEQIVGIISHSSRHAAAIVVSDIDIFKTMGTVRVKGFNYPVSMWDMGDVEANKYVKLDILGLINIGWIHIATELANIERIHSQAKHMDYNDWSVRDDILKYGTSTLFQLENQESATLKMLSDETINKIKSYNPDITMIELFSIILSVIRPGSASILSDVLNGVFHDYGVPEINNILKDSFGHVIYQEQTIALIQYAGFSASEADVIRRAISKKKADTINNWIPEFKETLISKIMTDYPDKDVNDVKEMVNGLAQIIIDSSAYSFNKAHAVAYSMIAMTTAWLRAHYPVEWLTAGYQIWNDNLNKVSILNRLARDKNINVERIQFRKSKALHFFDSSNTIYAGVLPIKGMNEQVGDFLYEHCKDKEYDSFAKLLLDITDPFTIKGYNKPFYELELDEIKKVDKLIKSGDVEIVCDDVVTPNSGQMLSLIRLDYFKEFGSITKLEKTYELFRSNYKKTNKTIKSKAKNFNIVLEEESKLKDEDMPIYDKAQYELQYLEKCTIKDERIPPKYALVTKIIKIYKTYTLAEIHSFNKGITTQVKVGSRTYNQISFEVGDIIEVGNSKLKERWNNPDEKDLWIDQLTYIRKK